MSIEKQEDGRWLADVEPVKGKRFRRRFKTKAEAVRFEAMVRERLAQNLDWNLKPKDKRPLSELVDSPCSPGCCRPQERRIYRLRKMDKHMPSSAIV